MNQSHLETLRRSVQTNCDISDARHGVDYGLCTYLLKMREYYRWEAGLGFSDSLDNEAVGRWLSQREMLWDGLDEKAFVPVELPGAALDPFDSEGVNALLNPQGLVYSGGLGRFGKPHFFLAELLERREGVGQTVYLAGRELARDLAAPPAMSLDRVIHIRRESLRRMLWEKLESWRWSRPDNALGRAFSCYPFDHDLEGALEAMTHHESNLLLLHEEGEEVAAEQLGAAWGEMLEDLLRTPAELAARAVRDHMADCAVTLPRLLEAADEPSIHFLVGNLSAMQKSLFPALESAYRTWCQEKQGDALSHVAAAGARHWPAVAAEMLQLHRKLGVEAAVAISELVGRRRL